MIIRLEMPFIEAAIESAKLIRWYPSLGAKVGFGQDLCDLAVTEVKRLGRQTSAHSLVQDRRRSKAKYFRLTDVVVRYRLVASEAAVLRRILVIEGNLVKVGEPLALFSSGESEPVPKNADEVMSKLRVVANIAPPEAEIV